MKLSRNIQISAIAVSAVLASHASAQSFDIVDASIDDIHAAFEAGEISCVDLVQGYLDRIDAFDSEINAIQALNPEAIAEAEALDSAYQSDGPVGPLHCATVLVKDQVEAIGMPTTYGSAIFEDFFSDRDATIVARMKDAGAIILGKATMGEYAGGFVGSAFGYCRNVYDVTRNPSGSSCGSGIAVAANFSTFAIAEDTGGSTRGPAAHTNTVGLRPTLGLISVHGMMPASPSRDTLGAITRTVRDNAIVTDVIAGFDPEDTLTAPSFGQIPETYLDFLDTGALGNARIGIIREPMHNDTDPESEDYAQVRAVIDQAVSDMEDLGAVIVDEVEIPGLGDLLQQVGSNAETEAAVDAYLAELTDPPVESFREIAVSDLVTPRRQNALRNAMNRSTSSIEHLSAQAARQELKQVVFQVMAANELDALVYATFDHSPAVIPEGVLDGVTDDYGQGSNRGLSPWLGFPALTVAAGFTSEGQPVGIDLMGRPYSEGLLFGLGYAFEQGTDHRRTPELTPALN